MQASAPPAPLADRPGGVTALDPSSPHVSQPEALGARPKTRASRGVRSSEAPGAQKAFRLVPDLVQPPGFPVRASVGLCDTRGRPRSCGDAREAPKVAAGQAARAAGPWAAGGLAALGRRPGAGTGAGAALRPPRGRLCASQTHKAEVVLCPFTGPFCAPQTQSAWRMEAAEGPGPGGQGPGPESPGPGGQEADPESPGPRCPLLSGFREELRALLLLAGPAVSKAASGTQDARVAPGDRGVGGGSERTGGWRAGAGGRGAQREPGGRASWCLRVRPGPRSAPSPGRTAGRGWHTWHSARRWHPPGRGEPPGSGHLLASRLSRAHSRGADSTEQTGSPNL